MFFNFDTNVLYNKFSSKRMLVLGIILLSVGINCLISKRSFGIVFFSWGIAIATLYMTYLLFLELKELKRYAEKEIINKVRVFTYSMLLVSLLLIIFPIYFNMVLSVILGILLLYREFRIFLSNRYLYNQRFNMWNITKILVGIILIFSPLFFLRFLVNILSCIAIIFGLFFINQSLKQNRYISVLQLKKRS